MAKLPTVRIKFEDRFKTINESDFDPETMQLYTPAPDPVADAGAALTRESIQTMKKGDVRELLEAHGVEDIPATVGEMREMATRLMFVEDSLPPPEDEPSDDFGVPPADQPEIDDEPIDDDEDLLG